MKTILYLPLVLSNGAPLLEPFRLATAVRLGRLPSSYWSGLHPPPLVPLPAPWRRQTVCGELSQPINYHTGPATGTVYQGTYWTTLPAAVSSQKPIQVHVVWKCLVNEWESVCWFAFGMACMTGYIRSDPDATHIQRRTCLEEDGVEVSLTFYNLPPSEVLFLMGPNYYMHIDSTLPLHFLGVVSSPQIKSSSSATLPYISSHLIAMASSLALLKTVLLWNAA